MFLVLERIGNIFPSDLDAAEYVSHSAMLFYKLTGLLCLVTVARAAIGQSGAFSMMSVHVCNNWHALN